MSKERIDTQALFKELGIPGEAVSFTVHADGSITAEVLLQREQKPDLANVGRYTQAALDAYHTGAVSNE